MVGTRLAQDFGKTGGTDWDESDVGGGGGEPPNQRRAVARAWRVWCGLMEKATATEAIRKATKSSNSPMGGKKSSTMPNEKIYSTDPARQRLAQSETLGSVPT